MITKEQLRKEYIDLRIKHGLTLRDAGILLEIGGSLLSMVENGSLPPIVQDTTTIVDAMCIYCKTPFNAHPLFCNGEPVMFPHWVCDECTNKSAMMDG